MRAWGLGFMFGGLGFRGLGFRVFVVLRIRIISLWCLSVCVRAAFVVAFL